MSFPWEKYGGTATKEEDGPWKKYKASPPSEAPSATPSTPAPVVVGSPPSAPAVSDDDEAPVPVSEAGKPAAASVAQPEGFSRGDAKYSEFRPEDVKPGERKDVAEFRNDQQLAEIGRERAEDREHFERLTPFGLGPTMMPVTEPPTLSGSAFV